MHGNFPDLDDLVAGITTGNRVLLAKAITLVESTRPDHVAFAQQVIERLSENIQGRSLRIGITGAPGSGKSTLIEALGMHLIKKDKKVAVLAIDPTSSVSHGSILGDKTRMEQLAAQPNAFIRPSPSGAALGGVARKTRETIFLVEAAGYDVVLIETVGVGQSEIAVHSMTDVFLLLLLPGAGDELQGIKRGIVEMADLLVVNKADGDRAQLASLAQTQYRNALHLFPAKPSNWIPQVLLCSAETGIGIEALWEQVLVYAEFTQENGFFYENRKKQALYWFKEALQMRLLEAFYAHPEVQHMIHRSTPDILNGKISPFAAADAVLKVWDK